MIDLSHLSMRFRRSVAVSDLSLNIPEGTAVALWGANGAGKTTILRCILGLLRYRGEIRVGGIDARRHGTKVRRLIGYVPQELGFYDDLRVGEAVHLVARLKGLRAANTGEALERVGLPGEQRKRIRELSGGMKQRLALTLALLGDPPILLLDEVTASLDAHGRDALMQLLGRLSGTGRTILFASHRVDEVMALADRVAVLDHGRLVATHAASELVDRLGHGATLHLRTAPERATMALDALRRSGFVATLNGVGIIVPVPNGQKGAPFRVLAEARIAVEDFDLVQTAHREAQP